MPSFSVAVRVRPGLAKDEDDSCITSGVCMGRELTVTAMPLPGQTKTAGQQIRFEFGKVFGPRATQHDVFELTSEQWRVAHSC